MDVYKITDLMQRAGEAAFNCLTTYYPEVKSITIICGKGNNGGDGFVVAAQAKLAGYVVKVLLLAKTTQLQGDAREAYEQAVTIKVEIQECLEEIPELTGELLIDAVLGIGGRGTVTGIYAQAIIKMNESKQRIISIDIPSGLDADSGEVNSYAVKADRTVTFIGIKQGLLLKQGPTFVGELNYFNLGVPQVLLDKISPMAQMLKLPTLGDLLPSRVHDSHKGDYGKILIIGGDLGGAGAVQMAAMAAFRVGAGKVWVATHPKHAALCDVNCIEPIVIGVDSTEALQALLNQVDAVLIGPGIGQAAWGEELIACAFNVEKPLVVDADGLNYLAKHHEVKENWILTPHPGEASRLLKTATQKIQADRLHQVKQLTENFGGVCVLKGASTLIHASSASLSTLCPYGNPGMAVAGMGDVLSGMIVGLCAQGLSLKTAAELGVYLHALAGDYASHQLGEYSLCATDLLKYISKVINKLTMKQFEGSGDVLVLSS